MVFVSDRQRRAVFARMLDKKAGDRNMAEVGSSTYSDIVTTPGKLTEVEGPISNVPDWVGAAPKAPEPMQAPPSEGLDYLVQYAKTIHHKRPPVGSIRVDDEYAMEGPIRLVVKDKVKKELDELLNVNSRNPDWVDMRKSGVGYTFLVGDKDVDITDPEDVRYIDEVLQTRLRNRLYNEGVLTESDLLGFRLRVLKDKFNL